MINRVGKSCLIKKFTKGTFKQIYNETVGTDLTNKTITLLNANENDQQPYPEISKIKFKLFDSQGKGGVCINTNFFGSVKGIFIVFDLTNEESFNNIENLIKIAKTYVEICKKNNFETEDTIIKQPDLFKDIPILIIGNKCDLVQERKVQKEKIDQIVEKIKNDYNITYLNYHEISVKNNIGVEKLFQDMIYFYLKRNFESIVYKSKVNEEQSDKDLSLSNFNNSSNNLGVVSNQSNENSQKDLFLDIKEDKEEKREKKRSSMDKSIVIFHQMIDKVKRQFSQEIALLKEENKNEINKLKSEFINEKEALVQKINNLENKNKELEERLKEKENENEIEALKQNINSTD